MGVNSLPKTVTRQRRDCDLNPGPSARYPLGYRAVVQVFKRQICVQPRPFADNVSLPWV